MGRIATGNVFQNDTVFPWFESSMIPKNGSAIRVVHRVEEETVRNPDGEVSEKLCLCFYGTKKRMILSGVNVKRLARLLGPELSAWAQQAIEIRCEDVQAFGKTHRTLRVVEALPPKNRIPKDQRQYLKDAPPVTDAEAQKILG